MTVSLIKSDTTTLRAALAADPYVLGMTVAGLLSWHGDLDDRPTGGDTAYAGYYGVSHNTHDYRTHQTDSHWLDFLSDADYVQIPHTLYGDYIGGAVERANFTAMTEDSPSWFVIVDYISYDTYSLALDLDQHWDCDDLRLFCDQLRSFADEYPLWDEGSMGEIESLIEHEDWESWGADDVTQIVASHILASTGVELDTDSDAVQTIVNDCFWGMRMDSLIDYETESAVSGYWPGLNDGTWTRTLAERVAAAL